jgi:Phage portal protein, SPP1 Gp6-like
MINVAQMMPQYEITKSDKKRQADIAYAWRAYCGELDPPLIPMDDQPDDNVLANYIEDKVEAGKNFLFGKEVEISIEDGIAEEVQTFLDETWGEKETRIPLLQELYINGSLAGQAFLRIVPQLDGSFSLVAQDPACTFVQTAPQDCKTPLLYCIEYCEEEQIAGQPVTIFYREEIARIDPQQNDPDSSSTFTDKDTKWLIQHWTKLEDRGAWQPAGDPITWPYPFAPIFTNQHMVRPNSFWGKPTVTRNLVHLNEALNVSNSNIQKLGRVTSGPVVYATGTNLTDIDHSPGHIVIMPTPDGKIEAVNIAADIPSLQAAADRLQSRIDEQTGIPGIATGRASAMPGGNMSGIAIELLFMSMIKRMDTERCLYGKLIIDVSKALLILNKMSADIKLTLNWQNPLPNDDTASWQAALLEKQVGVSDQTILEERGYDAEEEMERNQNEDAQKMLNFSRGQGMPPAQPQMQGEQGANPGQNESPFIGRGE